MTLSLQELQENLRDQIPQVLLEETGRELHKNVLADWTVSRQGELHLLGRADDQLRLVVPLHIDVRAYTSRQASRQERRGSEAHGGATLDAQLTLTADLALDISPDWHLVPTATVSYAWLQPPMLEVGPLQLDITRAVDEKLSAKLPEVAQRIEARMRERDRMPERMAQLWEQLSTPRPLPRPAGSWLVVEPSALAISTPRVEGAALRITAGMRGRIYTILGDPPTGSTAPLPRRTASLNDTAADADGLRLQVNVQLGWSALSTQTAAALNGRSWPLEVSGQKVGSFTITGAELYPTGDDVAVGLNYTATSTLWTTTGTLWLTGHPTLHVEEQSVRIDNFNYTVDTWDIAAAGINLDAVREGLLELLGEELHFPFGDQIADKLSQANTQLRRVELARGGELAATLEGASVQQMVLTDEALVLLAELRGKAQVRLPPPPPPSTDP